MAMDTLKGRVALVTGGGRGIGRAIALALARGGADVAVAARSGDEVAAVAKAIAGLSGGRRAHAMVLDLADRKAIAAAPGAIAAALGPIDILVNNAAIAESAPLHKMDDDFWDRHLAVDLTAPFLLTRACLPSMYERGYGRILNVASTAGRVGFPYTAAYCAAKHGILGLTRTCALEGAKRGVTANAVCPGWTDTNMMTNTMTRIAEMTGRPEPEVRKELLRENPLGRAVTPEEVAEVVLMLIQNAAITGQAYVIDGGEVMA